MKSNVPANYRDIVTALKDKIRKARLRASLKLNADLLSIYREIGSTIADQENKAGWGAKIVENLSADLRSEFQDMKGLSPRNLRYMRDFALAYPHFPFLQGELARSPEIGKAPEFETILQGELAKLTWYHHITLLDKVKDPEIRAFYIRQTIQNGWTRDVMVHQIDGGLYNIQGKLAHNFNLTVDRSELITQIFKDPYKFDFIHLGKEAKEKDLEQALAAQMTKVLQEFGPYFGFLGRQYRIVLGEKEFFFDLLFYHTKLKRYIVVELKIGDFKPEYVGKMDFYLNIADDKLRDGLDERSIGLILCKTKDGLVAEYALRDSGKPIGIAEYKLKELLPEAIRAELPSIEEIEQNMKEELWYIVEIRHTPTRMERLMQKLSSLQRKELQTPATFELLCNVFDQSVCPLFVYLLDRLQEFDSFFLTTSYFWNIGKNTSSLQELGTLWKNEDTLRTHQESSFFYRLDGFKKAGVYAFDVSLQLKIPLEQYHYGIKLVNYNDQQPFIRKLYGEAFSKTEIESISSLFYNKIADQIDWHVDQIDRMKNTANI
jgi:predicted nuclease of restriction endonuclease-like (RecB) superfamily